MKLLETTLPGVALVELAVFGDHRGRFMETYRRERYEELGVARGLAFVQDNFSVSARGILRGLHHQLTQPQGKLVHVTVGAVYDVAVDIRRGSPTFGQHFGTVLSADNHLQLWIPPGFAHGFVVLSDEAHVAYKVTAPYAKDDERSIAWNDPELAIAWPLDGIGSPVLSARDQAAPRLRDSELPVYDGDRR
jgi:dTDP-4-dehydrorhamnose 3,5-epimerase